MKRGFSMNAKSFAILNFRQDRGLYCGPQSNQGQDNLELR